MGTVLVDHTVLVDGGVVCVDTVGVEPSVSVDVSVVDEAVEVVSVVSLLGISVSDSAVVPVDSVVSHVVESGNGGVHVGDVSASCSNVVSSVSVPSGNIGVSSSSVVGNLSVVSTVDSKSVTSFSSVDISKVSEMLHVVQVNPTLLLVLSKLTFSILFT